jgi:hypothetical protein
MFPDGALLLLQPLISEVRQRCGAMASGVTASHELRPRFVRHFIQSSATPAGAVLAGRARR